MRSLVGRGVLLLMMLPLAGCRGDGRLPPVFGAVFGMSGAATTPSVVGKTPERLVAPGDRLVGAAANSPGVCIWQGSADRRFRAACPPENAI